MTKRRNAKTDAVKPASTGSVYALALVDAVTIEGVASESNGFSIVAGVKAGNAI